MTAWNRPLPWFLAWRDRRLKAAPAHRPAEVPRDNYPELEERRAAALRQMFPKLFSWYANRSEWMAAVEVQKYLAEATNIIDLENRIHVVEQRRRFGA